MNEKISFLRKEKYVLLIVGFFLLSANIGGVSIYILDEARNAECAREMWEQNEWIVPTYNYDLRTDKPPLHYYFMGLAYQLLGVSPLAARLFSTFFGLFTLLIVFSYTQRHLNESIAKLASWSLLGSIHFIFQFHLAVPDPYLIFFMTLSILAFFTGIQERNANQLYIGYAAVAFATLAKGIVAIGLVGLIMLLYLVASRKLTWQQLGSLRLLKGGILFSAIAVPWYVFVGYATDGEWLRGFFLDHNLERFSSEMEGHGGFFLLPLLYVVIGMLPASIFLPQTIFKIWQDRNNPLLLLSLTASAVIIGFFCFSATKLPNYTVPSYPFIAILLAYFISEHILKKNLKHIQWNLWTWLLVTVAMVVGSYIAIDIVSEEIGEIAPSVSLVTLPLALGAVLSIWLYYKQERTKMIYGLLVGGMLTSVFIWYIAFPKIDQSNSVLKGTAIIQEQEHIAYFIRMNQAFPFNLERGIPSLNTSSDVKGFWEKHPNGYIITDERHLEKLEFKFDTVLLQKDLFENTTTAILKK